MRIISLLLILILCACNHDKAQLAAALEQSKANRAELLKVIDHYSAAECNSLKLEAVMFLIKNMHGHYSYKGAGIDNYYKDITPIVSANYPAEEKNKLIDSIASKYDLYQDTIQDLQKITSDYLIYNIDRAFDDWQKRSWNKHLTFDQFCEYLLPYKCTELQQLDYWRDTLSAQFPSIFDRENPYAGQFDKYAYYPAILLNQDIRARLGRPVILNYAHYPFLSASTIHKLPYGLCDDYNNLAVSVLRSQGVPAVIDFFPLWSKGANGHSWFAILNSNGSLLKLHAGIESNPGDVFVPMDLYPKVYRKTYGQNEDIAKYHREAIYKDPKFTVFQKDVTPEYIATSDLVIPITTKGLKDKYVYIAIFDNKYWNPVDFGIIKNHKAIFKNMGRGIVYIALGFNGVKLVPISDPFLLHLDGEISSIIPDTTRLQQVRLLRKYPATDGTRDVEKRILGAKIQASNDPKFRECETLYTIDSLLFPNYTKLNPDKKYRYWRFLSAENTWCNLAELEFYENGADSAAKGRIVGTLTSFENRDYWSSTNAFDGDWLTFFHHDKPSGGWTGLDMGQPVWIDRFRCIPRSDDNAIHCGDTYELVYWRDGQWQSLGEQTAQEKFLYFDSVPVGALLLLRDHTQGVQERIFTYENGKQLFW